MGTSVAWHQEGRKNPPRARELAELAEIREKERDAAESERKRCSTLERKIAKVKEIVAVRETAVWLEETSPSMQKSAIGEDSEHLVTLQPNGEDDDDAGVPPIDEGIAAAKIWEPGENSDRKDDGLDPQIGHFALRGQLEISVSAYLRDRTHEGGRP